MIDSFISIDLETTGLSPKQDKIIEIGAVKYQKGRKAEVFSAFLNPGRLLSEPIRNLTGITQEQVDKGEELEKILPKLILFMEELPLVGHKILFDYSFLKKAAVDYKISFEKDGLDTLKIARHYLPELEHKNLDFLCGYYGIELQPHRALADAEATAKLYFRLAELFYKESDSLFIPKPLQYRAKRDTPATKAQKERLCYLLERHKLYVDYNVEKLTRREASRYTDKILAAFGR